MRVKAGVSATCTGPPVPRSPFRHLPQCVGHGRHSLCVCQIESLVQGIKVSRESKSLSNSDASFLSGHSGWCLWMAMDSEKVCALTQSGTLGRLLTPLRLSLLIYKVGITPPPPTHTQQEGQDSFQVLCDTFTLDTPHVSPPDSAL